jgi:alkylation response protein AidB-like acyl-CoA dehydrogenase
MIEWSEQHLMIRDAVRRFVDAEIVPNLEELEHGDMPPYDILRKLYSSFGMDEVATSRFEKQIAIEKQIAAGEAPAEKKKRARDTGGRGDAAAMQLIPIIELCRYCPGMVTALGVSTGLTGAAIMSKGTVEQKERWGLDVLTLKKIGAWAITEPGSGSDAFGSMRATARLQDDGGYLLNGNKTFITNGPYADTIVFICKLDEEGVDPRDRKVMNFVLDRGMEGLEQSKPMRKMGLHSSPTGELFLQDVVAGADRLLGGKAVSRSKSGAKDTFSIERAGVAAMALGIIDRCQELSIDYARERVQFGKPIGEFQLIQDKLARMEVARLNVQNLVFRVIEGAELGRGVTLAEASAMKLYSARAAVKVAQEAVQIFGGNGYMSEYRVEQLARDARVLQIYAGTDEIQICAIARDLLTR